MKQHWVKFSVVFLILLLAWPMAAGAKGVVSLTVEGRIGAFSPKEPKIEIDGRFYRIPRGINVVDVEGNRLTFKDLKKGAWARMTGERMKIENHDVTYYKKIVVESSE